MIHETLLGIIDSSQKTGDWQQAIEVQSSFNNFCNDLSNFYIDIEISRAVVNECFEYFKQECFDQFDVTIKHKEVHGEFQTLRLIGLKHLQAKDQIFRLIEGQQEEIKLPHHWEDKDKMVGKDNTNLIIKDLVDTSQEFKDIEAQFKSTMSAAVVDKIQRIQNKLY